MEIELGPPLRPRKQTDPVAGSVHCFEPAKRCGYVTHDFGKDTIEPEGSTSEREAIAKIPIDLRRQSLFLLVVRLK